MTKYARIAENVAIDVIGGDPAEHFHADIASDFVSVPEEVKHGWILDPQTGSWSAPQPAASTPTAKTAFTPPEFLLLFTAAERVAIRAVRESNPVIFDWLAILEDPRLTFVDVSLQQTQDGIDYLAAQGLITAERAAEIKQGTTL